MIPQNSPFERPPIVLLELEVLLVLLVPLLALLVLVLDPILVIYVLVRMRDSWYSGGNGRGGVFTTEVVNEL
jgi:hypothetical protein